MKKIIIAILILFITSFVYADKIQIPFKCKPKLLQQRFHEAGLKLDLKSEDYAADSWGLLENKGSEFWLYTYNPVTLEELTLVRKIVNSKEYIEGE